MRLFREKIRFKQSDMCEKLNISQPLYSKYEKGTRIPTPVREKLHEMGLNLNWLDTSHGDMLIDQSQFESMVAEPRATYFHEKNNRPVTVSDLEAFEKRILDAMKNHAGSVLLEVLQKIEGLKKSQDK